MSWAPSSLPSDHAILSHYASSGNCEGRETLRGGRRNSLPSTYFRPRTVALGSPMRHGVLASETTSLLRDSTVLVHHEYPVNGVEHNDSTAAMFWDELGVLVKYTLPVFCTQLLEYSFVIASVVSIGHLSTTALAASALGSMTATVSGFSIIHGFSSALDTVLPSAWTGPQPDMVGLWTQRMTVVTIFAMMPTVVIWLNAEAILLFLQQPPEVASLAAVYLKWSLLGLPAYAFNYISRRYFQSQGLFTVPTRIVLSVAPINALLNWALVWGPEPIRLGFIGAPIASAISFNLVAFLSFGYGALFIPQTAWHPLSRRSFVNLGILVRLGLSGVGQVASEWWSWELVALAASMLGPTPLASQSVLLVSASTAWQVPFALSIATSVRVGNLLGEGKASQAGISANTSLILALVMASLFSSLFLLFRHSWAYMFNSDPEVVKLVASILPLVALFQIFDGTAAVTGGILRAQGKQFTGALLNLSAYYILGIPLGIWLAFKKHLGLHGLWIGLSVALTYCAVLGAYICIRTDWQEEKQKVLERLTKGEDVQSNI